MQAGKPRRDAFHERKARPPHQRPIAEYPKIFIGGRLRKVHERQLQCSEGASFANSHEGAVQARDDGEEMA